MKREGPAAVAFATGLIVVLAYFLKAPPVKSLATKVSNWLVLISAFALALGAFNMVQIHGHKAVARKKDWFYSIIFLGFFGVALFLGVFMGSSSPEYQYIWKNLYQPASATMYSFTMFYMASAAWRAFRIRNWQSLVLMVTGFIVILGQVGLGQALSPHIPKISQWLINYPNSAGIRAITIGGSLGMLSVSVRIILGLERTYMTGGGEN